MVAMSHPDDVARLREIKRLLERIQRLPRLAGVPADGPFHAPVESALERAPEAASGPAPEPRDGLATVHRARPVHAGLNGHHAAGHLGASAGPPHPVAELDLGPAPEPEETDMTGLDARHDPLPSAFDRFDRDEGRGDYWTTDWEPDPVTQRVTEPIAGSRALVAVRDATASGFGFSPWMFIVATAINTVVAAVLAIVITLGVARREPVPTDADKVATIVKPGGEGRSEPVVPRPLELRPIGSAKEPLRLEAMKPAPLPFEVRPEEALEESYILVLSGLPANATISGAGAIRMGADSWHLPPGALAKLEIVVPEWSATVYEVGVELRRTNGAVAAQSKLWLAVPPPPTPKGASLDDAALKELVRAGDKHLSRGDVAAARAVYERAASMGSAQGALAMGTTFDPRRLWALGVFGMVGNKERARHWYQRALELGHPEARARLAQLQ